MGLGSALRALTPTGAEEGVGRHGGSPHHLYLLQKRSGAVAGSLFFQGEPVSPSSPPLRRGEPQHALLGSVTLQHAQEPLACNSPLCQTASFTGRLSCERWGPAASHLLYKLHEALREKYIKTSLGCGHRNNSTPSLPFPIICPSIILPWYRKK